MPTNTTAAPPEREVDVRVTFTVKAHYGSYTFEINQRYDNAGTTAREQVDAALAATADVARRWISEIPADGSGAVG